MDNELRVPPALQQLRQAMQPLLQCVRAELAAQAAPTTPVFDPVALLSRHFDDLKGLIDRLALRVEDLNADVAADPRADARDVERAVGRLAASIDGFVAGLREARALRAAGDAAPLPALLAGAYAHVLNEIAQWLGLIVDALGDPAAEYARQGLPTDAPAEMQLALKLTPPPQIRLIEEWIRRQKPPQAATLIDTASALLLGWAIAGALTGNRCD